MRLLILLIVLLPSVALAEMPSALESPEPTLVPPAPKVEAALPTPKAEADPDPYDSLLAEARADKSSVAPDEKTPAQPESSLWLLCFGAGIIALAGWGFTQYRRRRPDFEVSDIEHLHSISIGPKHQVSLVEVEGVRLVIGTTDGAISTLHTFDSRPERQASGAQNEWFEALEVARASEVTREEPVEASRDIFDDFDRKSARPARKSRANRESDSVMIGLEALEKRRGVA